MRTMIHVPLMQPTCPLPWCCLMLFLQEAFVKRSLKRIREKTAEKEMWVGRSFVTEDYLRDTLNLKELLGSMGDTVILDII